MPVSVWTSTLKRTIQTAEHLPFPKLRWKVPPSARAPQDSTYIRLPYVLCNMPACAVQLCYGSLRSLRSHLSRIFSSVDDGVAVGQYAPEKGLHAASKNG